MKLNNFIAFLCRTFSCCAFLILKILFSLTHRPITNWRLKWKKNFAAAVVVVIFFYSFFSLRRCSLTVCFWYVNAKNSGKTSNLTSKVNPIWQSRLGTILKRLLKIEILFQLLPKLQSSIDLVWNRILRVMRENG